jgi:hypothetical protein
MAKAGRGKGGRGKGGPTPRSEGDFHEAYENSGYYRKAGLSASYHETNSGSRTEDAGYPSKQALEWLEGKAQRGAHHKFGKKWHYPKDWPPRYYDEEKPCCPPQVLGKAEAYFKEAKGCLVNYLGLDYKYIGPNKDFACKQHWEPHPYPGFGHRRRGARTGKGSWGEPQAEEDMEEDDRKDASAQEERKAGAWFG